MNRNRCRWSNYLKNFYKNSFCWVFFLMYIQARQKGLVWTAHALSKLRFYQLSKSRVTRVINNPLRVEEGVADSTIAVMQPAGNTKHPFELWVMIQDAGASRKIISAWRYPGITKPGEPLPRSILYSLRNAVEEALGA